MSLPFSVRLKPDRPRWQRRRPNRCSRAVMCVLIVDWLTLSSICAAEKPPASTTFANTRSNRRSPSLKLASMLSPHQRQPALILMFAPDGHKALSRQPSLPHELIFPGDRLTEAPAVKG